MKLKGIIQTGDIFVSGRKLYPDLSQKVVNHSPDGFSWGYGGSGPAQLALALCLMATDEETACNLYQKLKWEKIATLPQTDFEIELDLETWIRVNGGKVNRSKWEESLIGEDAIENGSKSGHCTKGHEEKCAYAGSRGCDCNCGGANHGKFKRQTLF
jgi:hypothetical protein